MVMATTRATARTKHGCNPDHFAFVSSCDGCIYLEKQKALSLLATFSIIVRFGLRFEAEILHASYVTRDIW